MGCYIYYMNEQLATAIKVAHDTIHSSYHLTDEELQTAVDVFKPTVEVLDALGPTYGHARTAINDIVQYCESALWGRKHP